MGYQGNLRLNIPPELAQGLRPGSVIIGHCAVEERGEGVNGGLRVPLIWEFRNQSLIDDGRPSLDYLPCIDDFGLLQDW